MRQHVQLLPALQTPADWSRSHFSVSGCLNLLCTTAQVQKLQRACLQNPVKVEVSAKYTTVDTLRQQYLFVPAKHKVCFPCHRFRIPATQQLLSIGTSGLPARSPSAISPELQACRRSCMLLVQAVHSARGFHAVHSDCGSHYQLAHHYRLCAS